VVFGIGVEDAERLTALIERHDRPEPAYAAVGTKPGARDVPARTGGPLAVPRQLPSVAPSKHIGHPLTDVLVPADSSSYDEPLYRQAAAAVRQAAAARDTASRASASRAGSDALDFAGAPFSHDDTDPMPAALPEHSDQSSLADLVSPEWMGSLAMAAFTARTEAEARIKAALSTPADERADASEPDTDAGQGLVVANGTHAVGSGDGPAMPDEASLAAAPRVFATDVLEPLPTPEVATTAEVAGPELAEELGPDYQDRDARGPDARGRDVRGRGSRRREARERDLDARDVDDQDVADHDSPDRAVHEPGASDRDAEDQVGVEKVVFVDDPDVDDPDADEEDVYAQDADEDASELDAVVAQPGGQASGTAKRGRVTRSYPIARLSKTKRPATSSDPADS
jgi:hypothetical protein